MSALNQIRTEFSEQDLDPKSRLAREWFIHKVEEMTGKIDRQEVLRGEPVKRTTDSVIGSMYMFFYNPKHKSTLPYYDEFPLVIVLDINNDGFTGLNLHYLPLDLRTRFLNTLLNDYLTDKKYDEDTRFALTYQMLKATQRLRYFKPCIKKYLTTKVVGVMGKVPPDEWMFASVLPTADFKKKDETEVHEISRKMVNRI